MRTLSKSKLIAFRQCPKRLWLEIHKPELRADSAATQATFQTGFQVGDLARKLYDPNGEGETIDAQRDGFDHAFARTAELLGRAKPIFEAAFSANGTLAFADVLLPLDSDGGRRWRMVEVKSSGSVKDYYRDDIAIQAFAARSAGVSLERVSIAHVDTSWTYPGDGDYQGLLVEHDLTEEAFGRTDEVRSWIADAQAIVAKPAEPDIQTGNQCSKPFECGFLSYCNSQEPQAEYPVTWLPRIQSNALKAHVASLAVADLRAVPDELLNERQLRVKDATVSGRPYFDAAGAREDLRAYPLPAYFLDFETVNPAVPVWKGTKPYGQVPFQFSLHRLLANGHLDARGFLDLSGSDPSKPFAEALIAACGVSGSIFVYNAKFENGRIKELAARFPDLSRDLEEISERIVDLHPVAERRYYHPSQRGSWSIKSVLPAIATERSLSYSELAGVQDGGMAMAAYVEAIHPATSAERKAEIDRQLRAYCNLDTLAMVRLWQYLAGRGELPIRY